MTELKKRSRKVESDIEEKLQAYQQIDSGLSINVLATDEETPLDFSEARRLERSLSELIREFAAILNEMSRAAKSNKSVSANAYLQRCREVLAEDRDFFRKVKSSIAKKEESAELFRERNEARQSELSDTDLLLQEREHIANSNRKVDEIYNAALGTKEHLNHQRRVFLASDGRMSKMLGTFPGMSRIMDAIRKKKSRDQKILAAVIGGLLFFVIWWYLL